MRDTWAAGMNLRQTNRVSVLERAMSQGLRDIRQHRRGDRRVRRLVPWLSLLAPSVCACGVTLEKTGDSLPLPSAAVMRIQLPDAFLYLPGETMRFELRVRGVLVGRAALAVGEPGLLRGRRAIVVRSEVRSAGVGQLVKEIRNESKTWLDLAEGRVIEQHAEVRMGKRDMIVDTRFDANQVVIEYERRQENRPPPSPRTGSAPVPVGSVPARVFGGTARHPRVRPRSVPAGRNAPAVKSPVPRPRPRLRYTLPSNEYGMDVHAVLGALRAWRREAGDHLYFYGVSDRLVWHNHLVFKGTDMIRTPMGLYSALRFEGVATRMTRKLLPNPHRTPRSYTLWLSDDHKRVPLRLTADTEYGEVSIDLVDYASPARRSVMAHRIGSGAGL